MENYYAKWGVRWKEKQTGYKKNIDLSNNYYKSSQFLRRYKFRLKI